MDGHQPDKDIRTASTKNHFLKKTSECGTDTQSSNSSRQRTS